MDRKISVLLVDDEDAFRMTAAKIMERRGFVVSTVDNGADALDRLQVISPDVVVLDERMPGLSGEEVLPHIVAGHPETRVIVLTGHGDARGAVRALRAGAFDYLAKPCDIEILTSRIADAVAIAPVVRQRERTVADIMIPIDSYVSVQKDATVYEGIRKIRESHENLFSQGLMLVSGHRAVLVFDGEKLTGVLAMRNLIQAIRPEYFGKGKLTLEYSPMFWKGLLSTQIKHLGKLRVADIMNPCPPIVDESANLMHAADLLYSENRRRVAVARDGRIVGVVREQELFYEISRLMLDDKS